MIDLSCLVAGVVGLAKTLSTTTSEMETSLVDAFLNGCGRLGYLRGGRCPVVPLPCLGSHVHSGHGVLISLFAARDHMQDLEAHLACKSESFSLDKLAIYQEICCQSITKVESLWDGPSDLDELAEKAADAAFAEVCARLKADQKAYFKYVSAKSQAEGKEHVTKVLHLQAECEKGKMLANKWMNNNCLVVNTSTETKTISAITDGFVRRCQKAFVEMDMFHICWLDWSKLGRLRQTDVNDMIDLARAVVNLNPVKACVVMLAPLLVSESVMGGLRGEHRPDA